MGIGIAIDAAVGLFALFSCWRGWKQGLLYQLGQAAAVVGAWLAARALGRLLVDPLMDATGLSGPLAGTIAFFSVFFLLVLIGSLLVRGLTRNLLSFSETITDLNRALGVIVGGAKGLLIAYLAIIGLMMAQRLTQKIPIPFDASVSGRWARDHNFLDGDLFPHAKAAAKVAWLLSSRDHAELANDPNVKALIAHPKAGLLRTPEVIAAAGNGDIAGLLDNPEVWAFLEDPEVQRLLDAIDWDAHGARDPASAGLTPDTDAAKHP